jgi:hypothetical protein
MWHHLVPSVSAPFSSLIRTAKHSSKHLAQVHHRLWKISSLPCINSIYAPLGIRMHGLCNQCKIDITPDALLQTMNCISTTQPSTHHPDLGRPDHFVENMGCNESSATFHPPFGARWPWSFCGKYGMQGKQKSSENSPSHVQLQLGTLSLTSELTLWSHSFGKKIQRRQSIYGVTIKPSITRDFISGLSKIKVGIVS